MAAPALSATRTVVSGAAAANITVNAMARAVGDGLATSIWLENSAGTPTTPAGWTLLASKAGTSNFKEWVYGRIASNTATDNFASTFASVFRFGEMRKITGSPAEVAKWIVGTQTSGSGTVTTVNGITTTSTENLVLAFWNSFNETTTTKIEPAGWTQDPGTWTPLASRTQETAAAVANLVQTHTPTNPWIGVAMIAIPPAVSGTTFQREQADTITFTDAASKKPTKALADTWTLTDAAVRSIKKPIAETLTFADALFKLHPPRSQADTITFTDAGSKKPTKVGADIITFGSSLGKVVQKLLADALTFTDASSRSTKKAAADSISFTDAAAKTATKVQNDTITFKEKWLIPSLVGTFLRYLGKWIRIK